MYVQFLRQVVPASDCREIEIPRGFVRARVPRGATWGHNVLEAGQHSNAYLKWIYVFRRHMDSAAWIIVFKRSIYPSACVAIEVSSLKV